MPIVLVVEDKADARRPLAKLLRQEGYDVLTAVNAYQAMAAIRSSRPDLILMDVGIAPIDGLTCLMLMHEENPAFEVPVMLVTGFSDENTIARAQQMGVKAHLVKSQFTPEQLLELVRQYAGSASPPRTPHQPD